MLPHVELNRAFWPLRDTEEHDPDLLRAKSAFGLDETHWSELLECARFVILAEAGTGKTHEVRQTARRLRGEGKAAFFCNISDLAETGLERALVEGNYENLCSWLEGDEPAWFLLDSVDEARLAEPRSFERALRALARALNDATARAHIYITARVSDWRPNADLALVKEVLPPPRPRTEGVLEEGENQQPRQDATARTKKDTSPQQIVVAQLARLNIDQMRQFASAQKVSDVGAFMEAIERTDTEIFAERPEDLLELISYWKQHERIGSHAEMLDFNIQRKLAERDPDRDQRRPLASAKAFEGAMLLASAVTLTRKSSLILPDQPVDPGRAAQAVAAKQILHDWNARDIQTLLGRPLFDEATYGRVQFHHRSVREYLTAQWLHHLLESNKPRRAIEALIFARRYSMDVVVPSMRPMAAWLALRDERIRGRILAIAPEVLIEHGDPSRLPLDVRSRLLRQFASLNEGRRDTGASFDIFSVRRLADPQLAGTVLQLLDRYRADEDTRQLLLLTVWQGAIFDCAEAALTFALDASMDPYTRVCAIRAVQAAGSREQKRSLADAILDDISSWGQRELAAAISGLYPSSLTLDELCRILDIVGPVARHDFNPFEQSMDKIIGLKSSPAQKEDLLYRILSLLRSEPYVSHNFRTSQKHSWLIGYAARLAEQIILATDAQCSEFDEAVLRAITLVVQGEFHHGDYRKLDHKLKDLVNDRRSLRQGLFWYAVKEQRRKLSKKGERLTEWWRVRIELEYYFNLDISDFDEFLRNVAACEEMDDRLVALTAAFAVWRDAGRPRKGRERMWRSVNGQPELEAKLRGLLQPKPASREHRNWRRQERKWKERQAARHEQEEQALSEWKSRLQRRIERIRNLDQSTKDECFPDLFRLARRITDLAQSSTRWGSDRWDLLEAEFGREIAEAARDGLMRNWRLYDPEAHSKAYGNRTTYGTIVALTGLAVEAREDPGWARRLSEREALIAARYATHEMNGLPDWAPDLMTAHPAAFDEVMGEELAWEFELPSENPQPNHMLSTLRHGSETIRQRYRPLVLQLLEQHEPAHAETLENALSLLLGWENLDQVAIGDLGRRRYESSTDDGRRLTWLVAWMCVDAEGALDDLCRWVGQAPDLPVADQHTIAFCNAAMAHHEIRFGSVKRDFERIEILRRLVPLVYRHVRIEDDNVHAGAYSPDDRDDAETFRGYLLGRIAQSPGRMAFDTLMAFSRELPGEWTRDRMIVLARRRAAEDAEPATWAVSDVLTFADQAEREHARLATCSNWSALDSTI